MNVINVTINGMEYNLKGEENEEYLHKVARHVDKKLKGIMKGNPKLSVSSAAVLTAINTTDDMFKCDEAYEELQQDMDKQISRVNSLEQEIESLKKQLKYLEDYNSELALKLKNATNEQYVREKEKDVEKLNNELKITQESAKDYLEERNKLKAENQELRFQIQSYKYKTMDLQHKLIENGISLAKAKKNSNPLLASET
jgi:cell division protein ZapA